MKILLPGGAGLVGQNLVARLKVKGFSNIIVLDKHRANLGILRRLQPDIIAEYADLAEPGAWQQHFVDADVVVMLQAQIGGRNYQDFVRNNLDSTKLVLDSMQNGKVPFLIHVSSSVVESAAADFYSNTKKQQEKMVLERDAACLVLRPTLMFGWFDRKHLGWLSRLMRRLPFFPIPGDGRYMRQPLYVGDFVNIIISCIEGAARHGIYNISGHQKIDYIEMIREIKRAMQAKTILLPIPYSVFYALLWLWGLFDRNPPFTPQQLIALTVGDEFEVIDWPNIFSVPCTPFRIAVNETFNNSQYSGVTLEF